MLYSRNANNYNKLNYAYVNFLSDEDLVNTSDTHHLFKGTPLYWVPADQQTCNFCGSPDHFAKGCNSRRQQTNRNKKYQNVYKRFRPAQHRSNGQKKKSFADVVKTPDQRQPQQNQNPDLRNGTRKGESQHDPAVQN